MDEPPNDYLVFDISTDEACAKGSEWRRYKMLNLLGTRELDESTTDQVIDIIVGSCTFVPDYESIVETHGIKSV